jgi:hypothetical protein
LAEEVNAGKVRFDPGRGEVKIVGHSQGAAYAAGMAHELLGLGYRIVTMWYLAPHQPGDIDHPAGIPAMQLSRWSDKVATTGLAKSKKISGGSELKQIPGVKLEVLEDMEAGAFCLAYAPQSDPLNSTTSSAVLAGRSIGRRQTSANIQPWRLVDRPETMGFSKSSTILGGAKLEDRVTDWP